MEKNKIEQVCQSGGKILGNRLVNEDSIFVSSDGKICILMDGATGLGGPKSIDGLTPAEWYVANVISILKKSLYNYDKDLKIIIKEAVEYVTQLIREYEDKNNMKFEAFAEPSSSLLIYRENKDKEGREIIEIYEIGDSRVAIKEKNGSCRKLENPDEIKLGELDGSVLSRMKEISQEKGISVLEASSEPEIQDMLERNRSKKNTPDGYYVLGTSTDAVSNGPVHIFHKTDIEQVLMFSDGLNYEILDLSLSDVFEILKTEAGLKKLKSDIREAEEVDNECNNYPRFKTHDDISAILIIEGREQNIEEHNR